MSLMTTKTFSDVYKPGEPHEEKTNDWRDIRLKASKTMKFIFISIQNQFSLDTSVVVDL